MWHDKMEACATRYKKEHETYYKKEHETYYKKEFEHETCYIEVNTWSYMR